MRIRVIFKILEQEAVLWHPTARKWKGIGAFLKFGQRIVPANIAFFYVYADGDLIVALHGFVKKTQKTPDTEIRKALRIKKELGL